MRLIPHLPSRRRFSSLRRQRVSRALPGVHEGRDRGRTSDDTLCSLLNRLHKVSPLEFGLVTSFCDEEYSPQDEYYFLKRTEGVRLSG